MATSSDRPMTAEDLRAQIEHDYGQWEAGQQILVGNALAYDVGHPIPASNVDDEGRVVLDRHYCAGHENNRCSDFNKPVRWSDPGVAVRAEPPAEAKPAKAKATGA